MTDFSMTANELGEFLSSVEKDIFECEERKHYIAFRVVCIEQRLKRDGLKESSIDMLLSGIKSKYPDYFKD